MTSRLLIIASALLLAVTGNPAFADTETVPPGTTMLTVGSLIISGANLIAISVYDGSMGLGIAGVAVGTGLAVYAPIADTADDWEAFVGIGLVTAVIGAVDMVSAHRSRWDVELLGMRLRPAAGSLDGERWYGVQFVMN